MTVVTMPMESTTATAEADDLHVHELPSQGILIYRHPHMHCGVKNSEGTPLLLTTLILVKCVFHGVIHGGQSLQLDWSWVSDAFLL